jgi:hypothetical protein
MSERTQVLIAVDPPLFGTALAAVVRSWPLGVVVWADGGEEIDCDVAVVTGALPVGVAARSVLTLPDLETGSPVGVLKVDGTWSSVELVGIDDVFGVIRSAVA